MAVNKIILIGNVGNDPELNYTGSGTAVAKFSLATTEKWKDQSGEKKEKTNWHRCVVFGKRAEVIGEYVRKGSQLYIEGSMEYGSYDKDGVTMYTADVHVKDFQFIGGKREDGGNAGGGQSGGWGQQQQQQTERQGRTYPYGGGVPESQPANTATLKPEGKPQQRQMSQAERMLAQQAAQTQQQSSEPPMDFDDDIPF